MSGAAGTGGAGAAAAAAASAAALMASSTRCTIDVGEVARALGGQRQAAEVGQVTQKAAPALLRRGARCAPSAAAAAAAPPPPPPPPPAGALRPAAWSAASPSSAKTYSLLARGLVTEGSSEPPTTKGLSAAARSASRGVRQAPGRLSLSAIMRVGMVAGPPGARRVSAAAARAATARRCRPAWLSSAGSA